MMSTTGNTDTGIVRLVQFAKYPAKAKITLSGLDIDTIYNLRIGLFGAMGEDCANVGPEFNPLREINRWGEVNPYADPTRGRFD